MIFMCPSVLLRVLCVKSFSPRLSGDRRASLRAVKTGARDEGALSVHPFARLNPFPYILALRFTSTLYLHLTNVPEPARARASHFVHFDRRRTEKIMVQLLTARARQDLNADKPFFSLNEPIASFPLGKAHICSVVTTSAPSLH
jgi:hypothetical protein